MNELIYKQPLVLFLGAGASAPLGKMTTVQFLRWLKSQISLILPFINATKDHLKRQGENAEKLDVEAVLDFIEDFVNAGTLFHYYGGRGLLREMNELRKLASQQMLDSPKASPAIFDMQTNEEVRDQIKDLVVSHYSEIDSQTAFELYSPLLEPVLIRPLPVFTTNYDLSWEKTYELTSAESYQFRRAPFNLIDGFTRERIVIPSWSRSAYDDYKPTGADLILFKLHGSVDWVRTNSATIQRIEGQGRDPGRMKTQIVYPSQLKREIHEEPYRTNYDYLLACLLHAKVCAVIGFSFRDQEIVEEFRQGLELNEDLELMIVDPNAEMIQSYLKNKLGFDPRAELITEEFSLENASSLADKIKAKI